MYTMYKLSEDENTGLCKYSLVIYGPIAYIETTPEIAQEIINKLNGKYTEIK